MDSYTSKLELSFTTNNPLVSPQYATISITPRCNLRCTYCFQTERNRKPEPTFEELQQIIRDAKSLGVTRLSLSGGEAFLRNDLEELISFASKLGFVVGVDTNGMLLTIERGENLVANGLKYLCVSIDALSKKTNAKTRIGFLQDPRDVLDTLETLCRNEPSLKGIVLCTLSHQNYMEVPSLVKDIAKRGLSILLQPVNLTIHRRQENRSHWISIDNEDAFRQECIHLVEMKQRGMPIQNSVEFLLGLPDYMTGTCPRLDRCYVGYLHIIVNIDLQLESCAELPAIGDLRQQSLLEIWTSKSMNQLRNQIKAGNCPGCWSSCHTERSLRFIP